MGGDGLHSHDDESKQVNREMGRVKVTQRLLLGRAIRRMSKNEHLQVLNDERVEFRIQQSYLAVLETSWPSKPCVPVYQILFFGSVRIVDNNKTEAVPPNSWPTRLIPEARQMRIKRNGAWLTLRSIARDVPYFKAVLLSRLAISNFLFKLEDPE